MKTQEFKQTEILQELYDWAKKENRPYKDVIEEIATCGYTDEEVGSLIKGIVSNESFNIK